MKLSPYIKHFCTISKHKYIVMMECIKCGQIWRGLTHDNSKFGFTEFFSSARNFQGTRSPIEAEKEKYGYSLAWQHHRGHNPHHWEYWIDNLGTYRNDPIKIPYPYVVEMVCDWIGAGKVYSGEKWTTKEPLEYYNKVRSTRIFHRDTEILLVFFLDVISEQGLRIFYGLARNKNVRKLYEREYHPRE